MKIIRHASSNAAARKIVELAKSLPGVRTANKYRTSTTKYHVMITGDISDEVYKKLMGRHRNLAEEATRG